MLTRRVVVEEATKKRLNAVLASLGAGSAFLWTQVQYIQAMAFQYAQDPPNLRAYLQANYGGDLCYRMETRLDAFAVRALQMAEKTYSGLKRSNRLAADGKGPLESAARGYTTLRGLLRETKAFLEADASSTSEFFKDGWESKLTSVLPQTEARRLERLKILAQDEYKRLAKESPKVVKVIDIFHSILARDSQRPLDLDRFEKSDFEMEQLTKQAGEIRKQKRQRRDRKENPQLFPGGQGIFGRPGDAQASTAQERAAAPPAARYSVPIGKYSRPSGPDRPSGTLRGRETDVARPIAPSGPTADELRLAGAAVLSTGEPAPFAPPPEGGAFARYASQSGFAGLPQGPSVLVRPAGGIPEPGIPVPIGPTPVLGGRRVRLTYQHLQSTREFPLSDFADYDIDLLEVHKLLGAEAFRQATKPDDLEALREMMELPAAQGETWPLATLLQIFRGGYGPGHSGYGPDFPIPQGYQPAGEPAGNVNWLSLTGDLQPRQPPEPRDFGTGWNAVDFAALEMQENLAVLFEEVGIPPIW